jgi:hypothetical protein
MNYKNKCGNLLNEWFLYLQHLETKLNGDHERIKMYNACVIQFQNYQYKYYSNNTEIGSEDLYNEMIKYFKLQEIKML